jgi:hypothetical protein
MTIWTKCEIHYYFEAKGREEIDCRVRIDGEEIVLDLPDLTARTIYKGREVSPGHYKLECAENGGRGTLHRFPDDDVLEGRWREKGTEGMWRVQLIHE